METFLRRCLDDRRSRQIGAIQVGSQRYYRTDWRMLVRALLCQMTQGDDRSVHVVEKSQGLPITPHLVSSTVLPIKRIGGSSIRWRRDHHRQGRQADGQAGTDTAGDAAAEARRLGRTGRDVGGLRRISAGGSPSRLRGEIGAVHEERIRFQPSQARSGRAGSAWKDSRHHLARRRPPSVVQRSGPRGRRWQLSVSDQRCPTRVRREEARAPIGDLEARHPRGAPRWLKRRTGGWRETASWMTRPVPRRMGAQPYSLWRSLKVLLRKQRRRSQEYGTPPNTATSLRVLRRPSVYTTRLLTLRPPAEYKGAPPNTSAFFRVLR